MAILARSLAVRDYRSYDLFSLDLADGVNVLVGPNAAGKTNLVEAVQLLTAGQSFRRPSPRELVREGAAAGRIALRLEGEGRVVDMACDIAAGKRRFSRNGKHVAASGVRGVLPSVLFCPDHLDMVKRSAGVRRRALDDFGCQLNEAYAGLVAAYERTLEQRNSLLRDFTGGIELLGAWDEALAGTGAALVLHRRALLARLGKRIREVHAAIAPHEEAEVAYVSTLDGGDGAASDDRDALTDRFLELLRIRRAEEIRRGTTLVGPHRDEVLLTIDGRAARAFGSQGQQRSLVLAWKIAEVEVTHDILDRYPILLLDDVMSELDAARRDAIVRFIEGEIQTVITTTNLGYFGEGVLGQAKVVRIDGAPR
ncbi:MAG: DNA replication and repair protein RecF [Coriobacteriaceae bacterium]|nr:DNA replication and repair protein RecF [Coriobacteriaceae bacterium]